MVNKLWVGGIALYPFIFLKSNLSKERHKVLLNHEKIHIRQQVELLVIPFLIIYFLHYFLNLIKYRNHNTAYRNIAFEKEAFCNESDFNYLNLRKPWTFLYYFNETA